MRVRARKIVALVVAIAIVLALLLSLLAVFSSSTAAAHAEMHRSAPNPGQVVGGVVDRVEMEFRDPIRPHQSNGVGLLYPDGTRILTTIEVNGHLVRGRFNPLTEPGTYKVIWQLLDDSDGDWNPPEEFEFTYDPAAASPEWLPASAAEGSGGGGGISSSTLALVVIIPVAVVLAAWVFWPRKQVRGKKR